ncbi:hypothetical protein HY642_06775 [Candidatus Woesearchaeota archaeon]|nr:hypothetical protein [Candidatus Woesearchaeota archaeon]
MKKLLAALTLPFLIGCHSAQPQRAPLPPLEQNVERELRKLDSWAATCVKTSSNPNGYVQLETLPRKDVELLAKIGVVGFHARYDPKTDKLELPPSEDTAGVLDAVDHEMWHALYDDQGVRGLLHDAEYKGPSIDEIRLYALATTNSPAFDALRNKLKTADTVECINGATAKLKSMRQSLMKKLSLAATTLEEVLADKDDVSKYISEDDRKYLDSEKQKLAVIGKSFVRDATAYQEYVDATIIQGVTPTLEQARTVYAKLDDYAKLFDAYKKGSAAWDSAEKRAWQIHDAAEEHKYDTALKELDVRYAAEKDEQKKAAIDDLRKDCILRKDHLHLARSMRETQTKWSQIQDLDGLMGGLRAVTNRLKIDQILNDPNEIMARVIDSLYSLYYGEVEQNHFPLDKKDLEFLEKFTYNGKQMFSKGIERYRLGRQMLQDGIPADTVKQQLEYAKSFSYRGKNYDWPEADVVLDLIPEQVRAQGE